MNLIMIFDLIIKKIEDNINILFIVQNYITTMVKNANGGNKGKKMGRKFLTAPVDRKVRMAQEEGEIYASVTRNLGNGMFYANDTDGKERLCIMRNKFRGRGKRDNTIQVGGWVLIGAREFESAAKPKFDLLEVYSDIEKKKLKATGNAIFAKLISIEPNKPSEDDDDDEIMFETGGGNTAINYEHLIDTDTNKDPTGLDEEDDKDKYAYKNDMIDHNNTEDDVNIDDI